ncbi:hypothetical protein Bca4012_056017 [Brassica carinata]
MEEANVLILGHAKVGRLCKAGEVDEAYRYFSKMGFQSLARSRALFTLCSSLRSKALLHVSIRVMFQEGHGGLQSWQLREVRLDKIRQGDAENEHVYSSIKRCRAQRKDYGLRPNRQTNIISQRAMKHSILCKKMLWEKKDIDVLMHYTAKRMEELFASSAAIHEAKCNQSYVDRNCIALSRLRSMALDQQQPQASLDNDEQIQIQKHREYKERVLSSYQRLHGEIYSLDPASFFVPSFLKAVTSKSEENLKSIMVQAAPGIYTFEMLQPKFCEMLLEEVLHMEIWAHDSNLLLRRPSTLNIFGVALDDFGFENMLQKLLEDFISPISQVLFPEVCGSGLDSHHGYVVEYGEYIETDVAYHVDDSEVTLNVCLGKQFSGGELYFRGVRCVNHMDSPTGEEEHYDYPHVPGQAVLHHGSHRHGAKAITNGIRANLIMWCRSSTFRATMSSRKEFPRWCGKCRVDRYNSKRPV